MSFLTTAIGEFSVDLFEQLLKQDKNKNILFSPICITITLANLLFGSKGETASQMEKILHLNELQSARTGDSSATEIEHSAFSLTDAGCQCDEPGGIHSQLHAILSQLIKPMKDCDLNIINRLFVAKHFDFYQEYLHCIKQLYYAELKQVDFGTETEKTSLQINSWAESQTNGKIQELLAPGSLDPNAALVLVSALSFKGKWKFGFKEEDTKEAPFWMNKNESKDVPMMVQTGTFKYVSIEDPPLQVVELPYENKAMSMMILLPKDIDFNLEKLLNPDTYKKVKEWTSSSNMSERSVTVHLPRFQLEEECDLKATLTAMGLTLPFDQGKADFSGISKQHLYVSQATHKSLLEVNEAGSVGGAGTGIATDLLSEGPPVEFVADHPFVFYAMNNTVNIILLSGKYSFV